VLSRRVAQRLPTYVTYVTSAYGSRLLYTLCPAPQHGAQARLSRATRGRPPALGSGRPYSTSSSAVWLRSAAPSASGSTTCRTSTTTPAAAAAARNSSCASTCATTTCVRAALLGSNGGGALACEAGQLCWPPLHPTAAVKRVAGRNCCKMGLQDSARVRASSHSVLRQSASAARLVDAIRLQQSSKALSIAGRLECDHAIHYRGHG